MEATTAETTTAPAHWLVDMARIDKALRACDAIGMMDDGWTYIREDAPATLVDSYRFLVQMGYANGWMA